MARPATAGLFRLIDAIVLISALAVGLAMARDPYLQMDRETVAVVKGAPFLAWKMAYYYGCLAFPCITPLTFVLAFRGLCRRRSLRAFLRPGLAACMAASVALLLRGLEYLPYYAVGARWHLGPIDPWVSTGERVGYAVLGVWAALAAAGRWRPGTGWIERLGVVVGLLWALGAIDAVGLVLRTHGDDLLKASPWS
ncbi:MAG TPA: hypothetical protein VG406_10095 [Isosphaeraceae bacterium]|jgi:hypothetical protein|nr:hypothetical protein [Isosphaeraceae bacterium]